MKLSIYNKIMSQLFSGNYTTKDSGYVENTILVSSTGEWHTTCRNEWGGLYGVIREGCIQLSESEADYLRNSSFACEIPFDGYPSCKKW